MAQIVFNTVCGVDGTIQLRDNPFMDFWRMAFKMNKKRVPIRFNENSIKSITRMNPKTFIRDPERKSEYVNTVNSAINSLINNGYSWTRGLLPNHPESSDLNNIHRGFTTYMLTHSHDRLGISRENLIRLKWILPNLNSHHYTQFMLRAWDSNWRSIDEIAGYHDRFYELALPYLEAINAYVHRIESYHRYSTTQADWNNAYISGLPANIDAVECPCIEWSLKGLDGCSDAVKTDWNFGEFRSLDMSIYDSGPEYNVYDLKNILGKDYETALWDDDDPVEWDISNTFNTTKGSLEIRPWQHHLTHTTIKPWLRARGMPDGDFICAPISIGSISQAWIREFCYVEQGTHRDMRITEADLIE